MKTVSTITDLDNIIDGWITESLDANDAEHRNTIRKISREISDRAHSAGLIYGQDWEGFLAGIDSEELYKIAES